MANVMNTTVWRIGTTATLALALMLAVAVAYFAVVTGGSFSSTRAGGAAERTSQSTNVINNAPGVKDAPICLSDGICIVP